MAFWRRAPGQMSQMLSSWLKTGLRKCGKTKSFSNLTFKEFSFLKLLWKSNCVIFLKSHKNCYFSEKKKNTKIVQQRHGDFAFAPRAQFFLRIICKNCVLGSWPWPQAFLSLRRSVLEKSVLVLASDFFEFLASKVVSSTPPPISLSHRKSLFLKIFGDVTACHFWFAHQSKILAPSM